MKPLIITSIAIILTIAAIGAYLTPDDLKGCGDVPSNRSGCGTADAIVAISGGNTRARTDEAIRLYQTGWAKQLVFSGAAQDTTGPSNAKAMRQQALAAGIDDSAITIEEESRNTAQNAEKTRYILADKSARSVILVTSPYHQRRAGLEFNSQFAGMTIRNHPARDSHWTGWWWATPAGWWLAGGEIVKIIAFYVEGSR